MTDLSRAMPRADTMLLLPVMAVVLVAFLAIGIALPVLPLHVHRDLGLGSFAVGLVAGSQFAAAVLSRVWAGSYADRAGPKRGVLAGLAAAAAAGAIYVLSLTVAENPPLSATILAIGRAVLGGAESFIITSAVSWGLGLLDPSRSGRVIAWVGMAMFAALATGAPIGTALYSAGGFGAIAAATLLLPLAVGLVALRVPGIAPPRSEKRVPLLRIAGLVWKPGLGAALSSVGFGAILAFGSLLFAERAWQPPWLAFTAYGVGLIAARILFGHLPDKLGGARVSLVCVLVETAGLGLLWLADGPAVAAVGAALTGIGYSLVFPGLGLEAVRGAPPESRGLVMGLFTVFLDVALGLATPLLGLLADWTSVGSAFLASAGVVLCAAVVAWRLLPRSDRAA